MKIMWVVNIRLPIISRKRNEKNTSNIGGWLDRISEGLLIGNELMVCYPFSHAEDGIIDNLHYKGMPYDAKKMRLGSLDDRTGVLEARSIMEKFRPDIIHIHGTEFQYHWFFAEAAKEIGLQNRLIVSIQGLVGVYALHQKVNLPYSVVHSCTLRELIGKKNISSGIKQYYRRGSYENKTIKLTTNIMGRTTWDRACTYRINPHAEYHIGNETLREEFYYGNWDKDKCVKNRIFISQASYPVKGFHIFIEALRDIKKFYSDVTVHVAGADLSKSNPINGSSYALYIMKKLREYDLISCVHFCGNLTSQQMKEEMLQANVFVSPSTIENSPNSVGEAMLLGVPIVSSNVGGVSDLLVDKKEGYLYQSDAPYMLAYYVMQVLDDSKNAAVIGQNAREHAKITHSYENNLATLIDLYKKLSSDKYDD